MFDLSLVLEIVKHLLRFENRFDCDILQNVIEILNTII